MVHLFSANGLYDPNVTGGGKQPRGFDQLMALYDHYIVDEACLELWVTNPNSAACMVNIAIKDGTDTVTRKGVMEETVTTHKLIGGTTGNPTGYTKISVKPYQYLGLKMGEAELKGSNAANPSDQVIFSVSAMPVDSSIDAAALSFVAKLTYKARFIEPKRPAES